MTDKVRKPVEMPPLGGMYVARQVNAKFNFTDPTRRRLIREGKFPAPLILDDSGFIKRWTWKQIANHEARLAQDAADRQRFAGLAPGKRPVGRPRKLQPQTAGV